jgi:hypothetical protein
VGAGLNFVVWIVGSYWDFFFMKGKRVKKVEVDTRQCLLWW